MISDNSLAEAKRKLSLSEVMRLLGDGDRAKKSALCPFQDDTDESFSVFPGDDGQEHWKCHSKCQVSGDSIDYLARKRNLSTGDAIREFKKMAGMAHHNGERPKTSTTNSASTSTTTFNWSTCVSEMTAEHIVRVAQERGYSETFTQWLRRNN